MQCNEYITSFRMRLIQTFSSLCSLDFFRTPLAQLYQHVDDEAKMMFSNLVHRGRRQHDQVRRCKIEYRVEQIRRTREARSDVFRALIKGGGAVLNFILRAGD